MDEGMHVDPDAISIKGIRQGLLVTIGEGDWDVRIRSLEGHLSATPAFFQGGRIALEVGSRVLDRPTLERTQRLLARHQVELWAVVSTEETTKTAAREMGLLVEVTVPQTRGSEAPLGSDEREPAAQDMVVRRTLRSGQSLRHPGDVVIIGDINPGAEAVAGGNIIVWGRVRGIVHAGALGNEDAVICALDLAPTQLRIASIIARTPDERPGKPVPEMAVIRDEQIEAVPWHD